MSRAALLTSPTRVEATGLLWSLRAAGIDARTSPTERHDGQASAPDAEDVAVILALDIPSVDLEREVERCRALLGRPVPAVVVADRRFRAEHSLDRGSSRVLDVGLDTGAVLLLIRSLLDRVEGAGLSAPAAHDVGSSVGGLTPREEQVADLASEGLRNEEIAERLQISAHTVRTHVGRVLTKLDVQHRVALHARLRQLRSTTTRVSAGVGP